MPKVRVGVVLLVTLVVGVSPVVAVAEMPGTEPVTTDTASDTAPTAGVDVDSIDVDPADLSGSGTADDPYVITNASELQAMEDNLSANYTLGADDLAPEEPPTFTDSLYTGFQGNNVTFTIDMGSVGKAHVNLGSSTSNYYSGFDIQDVNDDGTVTIVVDTYNEGVLTKPDGPPPKQIRAVGSDTISNYTQSYGEPGTPLDPGTYALNVTLVDNPTQAEAIATFQITPFELADSITWTAPASAPNDSARILRSVTRDEASAIGDNFVVQINTTGPFAVLDSNYNLSTRSEDYAEYGIGLRIEQTNAKEMDTDRNVLYPNPLNTVVDTSRNSVYVIVDTEYANVKPGQEYNTTFIIDQRFTPFSITRNRTVSTTFEIQERVFNWGDTTNRTGDLNVHPEETTISGMSTVATGTTFRIRVSSKRDDVPFLFTDPSVRVQENGNFSTTFDFDTSEIEEGLATDPVPFSLRLRELNPPTDLADPIPLSGPRNVDGSVRPRPTCINDAVASDDGEISLSEIQEAINWWAESLEIPGTSGETISLSKIQSLIDAWAKSTTVSC